MTTKILVFFGKIESFLSKIAIYIITPTHETRTGSKIFVGFEKIIIQ